MTSAPPTTLGSYIRAKRTAAEMNQTRLGELIEQPQHVVSEYELDKRTPGPRTLALLAEHLPGADAAELLALIPGPR